MTPRRRPTATSRSSSCASPRPPRCRPRRWVGRGDKEAADQAAVDGMHAVLHTIHMDGVVVIGEGEKDEAPMLHNGEQVGDGSPPEVDIAVDPLEGTRLCAQGRPSALAVIALSEKGTMFDPGPCVYMEKMAGGPHIADLLDLDRPLGKTIELVAERKGTDVARRDGRRARPPAPRGGHRGDPRGGRARAADHRRRRLRRAAGGRARPPGRPAVGDRRHARGRHLRRRAQVLRRRARSAACGRATTTSARPPIDAGYDLDRVLTQDDLVKGDDAFFSATGVTDGDVLEGVRYEGRAARARSRSSCAAGRAPSAASPRATTATSCAR